jgi:hypothetical protein
MAAGGVLMQPDEEIISYTVEHSLGSIYAIVGVFSADHRVIRNRLVNLGDQGYTMLMSAAPEWAPQKPEGAFTESDLITVINMLSED